MKLLAAIKKEEKKLAKELGKLQGELDGLRKAAAALGKSAGDGIARVEKRTLSAAGRAAISKAAKKRWAKFRAQGKKVLG
jgi:hypothetical protein